MALNPLVDARDIRFSLFELLEIDRLGEKYPRFADFDRETYEEILDLAERIAVEKIYPTNAEGDKEGCHYDPQTKGVKLPESYKAPLDAYYEAGFLTISDEEEIGGMGMPFSIGATCTEMFIAASLAQTIYPGLAHGALLLIETFGTEEMKKLYCDKIRSGKWGGTMCLTEPEAGSDVGALKTKAVKQEDGTYLITGQKIFISGGDNDYYENMLHPVLARIEGDPKGTKGISIFLVPKYHVNPDGTLGEQNDVVCSGIEHKIGLKGSATCSMSFGDNNKCLGYLLGEERKGMKIMFQMMNEIRLGVGLQGLGISSSAYLHSVTYAKNRVQGTHVTQMLNPDAEGVPIIEHPDVKRMLLWMKSHVDGMRIFTHFLAKCIDIDHAGEGEEQQEAQALAEFLLPISKAGNSDTSVLVASEAIQILGGYGYCSDYPVEQLLRDAKIGPIFEGTNGIQSLDLTMRKLLLNKEQYNYQIFKKRVEQTITKAQGIVDEKYIDPVQKGIERVDEIVDMFKEQMTGGKYLHIFMNATPFQQAMHMLVMSWVHLWSLTAAQPALKELVGDTKGEERNKILSENRDAAFYSGRVLSSQYYIGVEMPKFFGRIDSLLAGETAVIKSSISTFSGAPEE
ncbi:MAG: acyl-CoA dehydrogenase [bacterium]|nr:acyl-CoA dehydrogenase [bacterium]